MFGARASLCHHMFTPLSHNMIINILYYINPTRCVNVNCFRSCKRARLSVYCVTKTLICVIVFNRIFLTVIWRLELRDVARLVLLFVRPMTSMRLHWTIAVSSTAQIYSCAISQYRESDFKAVFLDRYRGTFCIIIGLVCATWSGIGLCAHRRVKSNTPQMKHVKIPTTLKRLKHKMYSNVSRLCCVWYFKSFYDPLVEPICVASWVCASSRMACCKITDRTSMNSGFLWLNTLMGKHHVRFCSYGYKCQNCMFWKYADCSGIIRTLWPIVCGGSYWD